MNVVQTVPNSGAPAQWPTVTTHGPPAPSTGSSNDIRAGFTPRMVTGLLQAILGFILIVCGIVVVYVRIPNNYDNLGFTVAVSFADGNDKVGWGIWIGASVIFASVFGILSKRSQSMISLYMAFSIVVCVMSFAGIWAVTISLAASAGLKNNALRSRSHYSNPCGQYGDRYDDKYRYGSSFEDYYGYRLGYDDCIEKVLASLKLHVAIYSIMLICLVAEFVISIIGASFTCTGLDCCSSQPRRIIAYQTQVLGTQVHTSPVPSYTVQHVHPQQSPPAYNSSWATGATPRPTQAQWSNHQYKGYAGGQWSPQAMAPLPATQNESSTYLEPTSGANQGNRNDGYVPIDDPPSYTTNITPASGGNDQYYVTVTE